MPAYIVARISIADRNTYSEYEAGFMEVFSAHGGKLLSVDEAPTVLEGDWTCTRTILAEFPDKGAALAWYNSEAYQKLMQHRLAASTGEIALLSGLPA